MPAMFSHCAATASGTTSAGGEMYALACHDLHACEIAGTRPDHFAGEFAGDGGDLATLRRERHIVERADTAEA